MKARLAPTRKSLPSWPDIFDRYYFDGGCLFLVGLTAFVSLACLAAAVLAGWL